MPSERDATTTTTDAPEPPQAPEAAREAPPAAPPREVELKLELAPADWRRLARHPRLRAAVAAAGKPARLLATYFDTPDGRLRAAGASLRIRREGRARVQTLKLADGASAGLFDRREWEWPVAGDAPDLDRLAETDLADLFAKKKVRAGLAPAFSVSVRRRTIPFVEEGLRAEITLDEGVVAAGTRSEPLCELEIELVSGSPADLFGLARAIVEAVPARLGVRAKSARGYALAAGETAPIVKHVDVALAPSTSVGASFQAIARACLAQLVGNEAALRQLRAPGAVHQSRVALRRLRAAISLFRPAIADSRRAAVSAELKWMANALGDARDLDVYVTTTIEPLRAAEPDDPDVARLAEAFAARRERAYAGALEASSSARYRLMLIDVAAWVEAGDWLTGENAVRDEPIAGFAARVLRKRRKAIAQAGEGLAGLEPEPRHELRIEVKKLRYAAEFFESVFVDGKGGSIGRKKAKRRCRAMLDALEALQEDLGALNDLAVGATMASGFEEPDEALARGLARLARPDAPEAEAEHLASAVEAWRRLVDAKPFWA